MKITRWIKVTRMQTAELTITLTLLELEELNRECRELELFFKNRPVLTRLAVQFDLAEDRLRKRFANAPEQPLPAPQAVAK